MSAKYDLSIVIPAYKEEKRISIILDAIRKFQHLNTDLKIETIIVVDGSPDKTAEVVNSYKGVIDNLNIIDRKKNLGKGATVKEGVMAAQGNYILFTDADNSTPIEQVTKLLQFMKKYEVVIGSRYTRDGKLATPQPLTRRIGSRVLNIIIQMLAISGIRDTQCGFKLFQAEAAREIFTRTTLNNFSFDVELLAIAKKLGFKIKEVGITWYDNPHSTVSPIKDGFQMIKDAWYIRKNLMTGKYN